MRVGNGVVYIALGEKAAKQAEKNALNWAVQDSDIKIHFVKEYEDKGLVARWAKTNLDSITPFERTGYLDADTVVRSDIGAAFQVLEGGWDVVIVPSTQQGENLLWHLSHEEREQTMIELGYDPLQLQGGAFWFANNERVALFFARWREEWLRWKEADQGALLRAMRVGNLKVWLFGHPWNSSNGTVVQHRFGEARG